MGSGATLTYIILAGLVAAVILFAAWGRSPARRRRQIRAVPRVTPRAPGRQSCSYCRRKVDPKELAFYSGPEKVVGVCRQCRPQAERQSLLRL